MKKIMIVDDNPSLILTVKTGFQEIAAGYDIIEAKSGNECFDLLRQGKIPDLILLDIIMECCYEGYNLNQAIKYQEEYSAYRDIPIVMASSIEQPPDELFPMAPEVEMIRPDRYVTKPLNIPVFLDVIKKVLASRHPETMGVA